VAHLETGDWLAKSPLACEMAALMDRMAGRKEGEEHRA
jgi:hypothetical protein